MIVPPTKAWKRYGFALAMLAVATSVRLALDSILGTRLTNITYFVALLTTAWYAGFGPSILSLVVGTSMGTYLFLDYRAMAPVTLFTTLGLQVSVGFLVIFFINATRRMQKQVEREILERTRIGDIEREQSERLRITLRSIGDAVVVTDAESRVTSMNPIAEALTGWAESEAVGQPLKKVFRSIKEDTRSSAEMPVAEVLAAGRVVRTVEPALLISRNGRSRNVEYSSAPMKHADGKVIGVVLVCHDVTDRRQTEQRLAEQTQIAEALHSIGQRLAAELVPERIRRLVVEEASRLVSAEYAAFFGCDEQTLEVVIRSPFSNVPSTLGQSPLIASIFREDRVIRVKDFAREGAPKFVVPEGIRSFMAVRVESRSGKTFGALVFAHADPARFGANAERLTVGIAAQTAVALDNARLYQDVQESELRFRQMAEHISDVFYLMGSTEGEMLYVSPAFELIWEQDADRLIDEPGAFLEAVHPDDLPLLKEAIDARKQGETTATEYRIVGQQGQIRWIWDRAFPIKDASGRLLRIAGLAEDITERKTAEEALKESDRRKDEFLAMLAHELRNPLAPIRNALYMMKQTENGQGESIQGELAMVDRQITHMTHLIDDLLDVSRISRGKITLKLEPVAIVDLVRRTIATNQIMIENSFHSLRVDLPDASPWIMADPTRMEQILGNLLNNASKYTDPGGRIDIKVRQVGDSIELTIRDSGIGIDPKLLPRIFDLFVQAEQRIDRAQGGLGIGLSLVRDLVKMHGGDISVSSKGLGKGSEFVVRVPTIAAPVEIIPPTREAGGKPSSEPNETGSQKKRHKVLVVDDNVDAASSLAKLLTRLWGQDVRVANDGPSALVETASFNPDLIFLDIGLPGLSGYQVAERIRATPAFSDIKLVALTGWGQDSDFRKSKESGFDRHLVKPVAVESIHEILEDLDKELAEGRFIRTD